MDLQVAIWMLLGFSGPDIHSRYGTQPSADALTMYGDANINGAGFIPATGEIVAVKCITDGDAAQDLIIEVCMNAQGLTPGYWKNHIPAWTGTGYLPGQTLGSVFSNTGTPSTTLLQALNFGGGPGVTGAKQILLRAAVASLLNSASSSIYYVLTPSQVIVQVNAALATNNRAVILALATQLDNYNNL
jgi:hypothetical protein